MQRSTVLALVSLTAFGFKCGETTCDTGTTLDTASGECVTECTNSIRTIFPAQDSTDAYYRGTIEVTFDDREDAATFTVSSADGAVSGTTDWSGDTLIFTPDAPLAAATEYTLAIDYSCGTGIPASFTTSEVGTTVDTAGLVGRTFALDLATGRFVQPEGIGSILGDFVDQQVLIGVKSADASNIQMIGAIAATNNPPTQGECDPTIPFPEASFSGNPFFQIGPETTSLSISGFDVSIADLQISGAFGPDGSYISGAVLAGTIDTRPLVPLLDNTADCSDGAPRCCDTATDPSCDPANDTATCCDEAQICDLATQIGVSCIACDSDGGEFCLTLYVDSMQAVEVTGLVMAEQHSPVDNATAPPTSNNICDNPVCSADPACAVR